MEQCLKELEQVLDRILHANLKLKAKKCFLFRQEVEYLGHEVSGDGVRPLRGKVAALQHWATPAFWGWHFTTSTLLVIIVSASPH